MKKNVFSKIKEPIRLRDKKLTNGNLSLYLDIYNNGKRVYEFLRLYLIPERTKEDKRRNEETLRTANAIKAQRIVELQNGKHGFHVARKSKIGIIEYLEAEAAELEKYGKKRSAYTINSTISQLKRYCGESVQLNHIDKNFLLGYINFLKTETSSKGKPFANGTQRVYFGVVQKMLNKAVKDDILQFNPIQKIQHTDKPKDDESTKQYLTLDEVKALARTECKYEDVKRAFLFACFCGLRYSDIKNLEWGKIQVVGNGEKQVEILQQKTGQPLYLPLSDNALQWLPNRARAKDTDKVFSLPYLSTIETALSKWAKAAGVMKHVTFHVSRHTNATLMLAFGADIYTVSKLLGHTDVRTTQIYAKIVDENKRKTVNLIPELNID